MSKLSVFEQGWLDLVFEGRNKDYGAYQLRHDDSKTTIKAFFSGVGLMGLLIAIPFVLNSFKPAPDVMKNRDGIIIVEPGIIPLTETEIEEPKITEPESPAQKNPNTTTKFVRPEATSQTVTEPLPTTSQLHRTEIGSQTSEGGGREIIIGASSPDGVPEGTGTSSTSTEGMGAAPVEVFVDEMPEFPGGVDNFLKMVGNKFRTPEANRAMQLKVYVSFVVEPDGTMTNIKVSRDPGYNMAAEAERVLKSIKTRWKPGKKKGKEVRTAYSLPILVNLK